MPFLDKILTSVLFKILGRFLNYLTKYAIDYIESRKARKKYDEQAQAIMTTAEQIKKLLQEGKPVPQELKDKLRDESKKLIDGTFDTTIK